MQPSISKTLVHYGTALINGLLCLLCVYSEHKSGEILMFVCVQKDAKQCCDAKKFDGARGAGQ